MRQVVVHRDRIFAMSNLLDRDLNVVNRFAVALDEEDYAAALALIAADCVYSIQEKTHVGPEAIVQSYQGNGDTAARVFDSITYGSSVRAGADGWVVISFSDHITHAGERLDHVCEQWVRVNEVGVIARIEHHDLQGEQERLDAFRARHGIARDAPVQGD